MHFPLTEVSVAKNYTILVADDDDDIRLALTMLLSSKGYKFYEAKSPHTACQILIDHPDVDLALLDMNFSRDTTSGAEGLDLLAEFKRVDVPVILMTAWGTIDIAVQGLKQGACDFIEKPWNNTRLLNCIEHHLSNLSTATNNEISRYKHDKWIGYSPAMKKLEYLVSQIAPTDANVLILGENGTGKSQLAYRIHQLSNRKNKPFIEVNIGSIPESLFEAELFGHQKGAFTDAKRSREGRFELADSGTLFLDEIATLPINLQPKLLRVLESGQYEELGSSKTKKVNVRLISATNSDLTTMVKESSFRQDLLYRLNTLVISLPPLRERIEDITPLSYYFIEYFCKKYNKSIISITDNALLQLQHYSWPGNIRELSHVIERAVLLCAINKITPEYLSIDTLIPQNKNQPIQSLAATEKETIQQALEKTKGNIADASRLLDISRNALYRRLEKYAIQYDK